MRGSFFQSFDVDGSQFWKGLHQCKNYLQRLVTKKVHDGSKVDFWGDTWCGEVPFKVTFNKLFEISLHQKATVKEIWNNGNWNLVFRRNLSQERVLELDELRSMLQLVQLDDGIDEVIWPHTRTKTFTSKSMYRLLTFGGVRDTNMWGFWRSKIPLKIKHFLYLAGRGKLPCAEQLVKRKWKGGDELCKLCKKTETSDHILFCCPLAVFAWCVIKEALCLRNRPVSFWDNAGVV